MQDQHLEAGQIEKGQTISFVEGYEVRVDWVDRVGRFTTIRWYDLVTVTTYSRTMLDSERVRLIKANPPKTP